MTPVQLSPLSGPTPMRRAVGKLPAAQSPDGQTKVFVVVTSCTGSFEMWMSEDEAKTLGQALMEAGTGLTLPSHDVNLDPKVVPFRQDRNGDGP